MTLAIFFMLCVLPFVVYPNLTLIGTQPVDAAAEVGAQLRKLKGDIEVRQSLRAFFYHGAELGQFAACIFIVLSSSVKAQVISRGVRPGSAYLAGEALIYLLLMGVVYVSDSSTSKLMIGYALAVRYTQLRFLAIVPAIILAIQFVTQLVFAQAVASLLQSGSFWWRYKMAEIVTSASPALTFTPEKIGLQANWTHSIFLDFAATYGLAGPLILFGNQILMFLLPQYRSRAFGWSCLFLVVVAIQPVGASAVYLALALTLAYAESASRENAAMTSRQPRAGDPQKPVFDDLAGRRR